MLFRSRVALVRKDAMKALNVRQLENLVRHHVIHADANQTGIQLVIHPGLDLSHKPCYIVDRGVQGGGYKRVDNVDVPLSANEIYSLETADMLTAFDRQTVDDAFGSDLDEDLLSRAFKKAS